MSKYDNMCRCPWPVAGKYEPWGYKCVYCARTVCKECIDKGPSPFPGVYISVSGGPQCVCCRREVPKEVKKRPSEDEQWWEAQVDKHRRRVSVLESQNKRMRDGYAKIFNYLGMSERARSQVPGLNEETRRLAQAWMNTIPDTTTTEQESQTEET